MFIHSFIASYTVNYTVHLRGLDCSASRHIYYAINTTMKNFLPLIGFLLFPVILYSQNYGIWKYGDTTGFTPRFGLSATALDGKIYVMGGNIGNSPYQVNTLEVYDVASNSWNTPKTTGTFSPR